MLSHTLFHLILTMQKKQSVGKKSDFVFRLTMSIFRPMGSWYKNISKTWQQYPQATISFFFFFWSVDSLISTGYLASVKEEGIRTDTLFSWYSKNCKSTIRDKKKDALKITLTRFTSKHVIPSKCEINRILSQHVKVRRDLRNCLMNPDQRTVVKVRL